MGKHRIPKKKMGIVHSEESEAIIRRREIPKCPSCTNRKLTLSHKINGCTPNKSYNGYRHDQAQMIIVDELRGRRIQRINEDRSLGLRFWTSTEEF